MLDCFIEEEEVERKKVTEKKNNKKKRKEIKNRGSSRYACGLFMRLFGYFELTTS